MQKQMAENVFIPSLGILNQSEDVPDKEKDYVGMKCCDIILPRMKSFCKLALAPFNQKRIKVMKQ